MQLCGELSGRYFRYIQLPFGAESVAPEDFTGDFPFCNRQRIAGQAELHPVDSGDILFPIGKGKMEGPCAELIHDDILLQQYFPVRTLNGQLCTGDAAVYPAFSRF